MSLVKGIDSFLGVFEMTSGFPGVVRLGISLPFDKVLEVSAVYSGLRDGFYLIFGGAFYFLRWGFQEVRAVLGSFLERCEK